MLQEKALLTFLLLCPDYVLIVMRSYDDLRYHRNKYEVATAIHYTLYYLQLSFDLLNKINNSTIQNKNQILHNPCFEKPIRRVVVGDVTVT